MFECYPALHEPKEAELLNNYKSYTMGVLQAFSSEISNGEFSFSLTKRDENYMNWITFFAEDGLLTVDEYEHIFDPNVGGDMTLLWSYSLW